MKYARMTGTGLRVSQICLGTMTFGGQVDETEGNQILHAALDLGINFVDTADMYTGGESERIVGKALRGIRDKVVLATKVCNAVGPGPNDQGLGRIHILRGVEESLKRLQTDYIDIYYLHRPDHGTPLEETMSAMNDLVRAGKVRYIGLCNYASWSISDIRALCKEMGYSQAVINQTVYNLLTRGIEDELLPMSQAHSMGVIVYNPLASGLLTGKHLGNAPAEGSRLADSKLYYDRYWNDANLVAVEKLKAVAAKEGISLLEMALRWCANQPRIDSVLMGVSKLAHVTQNVRFLTNGALSEECLNACDQIWNELPLGNRFKYFR